MTIPTSIRTALLDTLQKIACPYSPSFMLNMDSEGSLEALEWLSKTLNAIKDKPSHRNCENAKRMMIIIGELVHSASKMHDTCHSKDDEIKKLKNELMECEERNSLLERTIESQRWVIEGGQPHEDNCPDPQGAHVTCPEGEEKQ